MTPEKNEAATMDKVMRILVLEDDPIMRETLSGALTDEGYQVDSCSRGDEAVSFARESHYDLLIADIRMEGLDGLGALSQVQSYQPNVGSLVVTGYASDAQNNRATRLGLNGFLEKPFELDDLLDTVEGILAARRDELLKKKNEEDLLAYACWNTEWTVQLLGSGSKFGYSALSAKVRRLCQNLGLEGTRAEQVCLAALWRASKFNKATCPPNCPPLIKEHLRGIEELWDGSGPNGLQGRAIPIESRIVAVALASMQTEDPRSKWPGRFDPVILTALEQLGEPEPESEENQGLIEVARTLIGVGDFGNAQKALQEIVNDDAASPNGVEAILELARLRQCMGEVGEARNLASRAPELASHFGPLLAANTGLRSGLLLAQLKSEDMAIVLLEESALTFADLGLDCDSARAHLAAKHYSNKSLEEDDLTRVGILMADENRAVLIESLAWLFPLLLESETDDPLPILTKLITEFPSTLARTLEFISPKARRRVLEVLENSPSSVEESILSSLLADPDPEIRRDTNRLVSTQVAGQGEPVLTFRALGKFEVLRGDVSIPNSAWKSTKVRYLLACLASKSSSVAEDLLLEQFWPGDVNKARKNLYATSSYLKKALSTAGSSLEIITRSPGGISLNPELNLWHDLSLLQEASKKAKLAQTGGQVSQAASHYRRMLALYEGPYLDGCYMDWAVEIRRQTEDQVLEASLYLARNSLEQQRFSEALECARTAVRIDPSLQEAHMLAMRAYLGLQRPTDAVRQYESCKAALAREFETEPSIDMERLHQQARLSL